LKRGQIFEIWPKKANLAILMLTKTTISGGNVTSCDITIAAILSDTIFSRNGCHFVSSLMMMSTMICHGGHCMTSYPMKSQTANISQQFMVTSTFICHGSHFVWC